MTDPIGKALLKMLENRFEKLAKEHKLMRIVGNKFTIWVTRKD